MAQLVLALENIRSAWNVGAIMRTCDALGAELLLVGYTARPVGKIKDRIKKTSIGAENWVKWKHIDHASEALELYKNAMHLAIEIDPKSLDIYSYLNGHGSSLKEFDHVVLWLGNEIHGVSENVIYNAEATLHLPMNGKKESLNVATTAGIAGYLLYPCLAE